MKALSEFLNETTLSGPLTKQEKTQLDSAIKIANKKAGSDRKAAIEYIIDLAKQKSGKHPVSLKQALQMLDYLDD